MRAPRYSDIFPPDTSLNAPSRLSQVTLPPWQQTGDSDEDATTVGRHRFPHAVMRPCFGQADDPHIAAIVANLSPNMVKEGEPVRGKSLAAAMAECRVPGVSIAFISPGKVAWVRSFGALSMGGAPVTPDTLFQASSISKPMAATAALHLVQQGKLSLDADVNTSIVHWKLPASDKAEGKTRYPAGAA